jgi:hypothetical protein
LAKGGFVVIDITGRGTFQLPDFFLLGAAKSGTTSLYRFFMEHPQICMSEKKEPWFFSGNIAPEISTGKKFAIPYMMTDLAQYTALFDKARTNQMLGEASPSYLYTHEVTIPNIKHLYAASDSWKRLKFVISLRNPIDRAWSMYWTHRRQVEEELEFTEAVNPEVISRRIGTNCFYDYIGGGMYSGQVRAYQQAFGKSAVKIILYDDLRKDTVIICRDIYDFLGIAPEVTPRDTTKNLNPSGKPRNKTIVKLLLSRNPAKLMFQRLLPWSFRQQLKLYIARKAFKKVTMGPAVRQSLREIYKDEIDQLASLIQRDLTGWKG